MASAPFGKLDIHYREVGAGPPLLLVHGLMTTSYSWRYVMHDLARDFRVIAPDLPGSGRSTKPPSGYTGAALASFLAEFCDALDIRGCLAVGNSMGGYLCMRAALADPTLFSRLVNIHSPGPVDTRYRTLHAALSIPGVRPLLSWWIRRAPQRWAHKNVHYFDESLKSIEEAAEYGDPLATLEGTRAFIAYLFETFDPRDLATFIADLTAHPFPTPLLLLYSRHDPLVPPSVGDVLHRLIPASTLHWLDDTSHFAHVDTPTPVLAAIRPFLTG
ncbi:MAG: hypothetical protein JWN44_6965 [Myxococcales bacterium]|nr:hypothetical protein [Myxococcales bacterium]